MSWSATRSRRSSKSKRRESFSLQWMCRERMVSVNQEEEDREGKGGKGVPVVVKGKELLRL